jgi:hypothetical protein
LRVVNIRIGLDHSLVLPAFFAEKSFTGSCTSTLSYTRLSCVDIFKTVKIGNKAIYTWSTKSIPKNEREFTLAVFTRMIN